MDPVSGERLDYQTVARQLEKIRTEFATDDISIHIIGFAKAVGDIANGGRSVIAFFFVAFAITAVLLYWYIGSLRIAGVVLACTLVPVLWLLGVLPLMGYGIDPMSILVPFLIFSIGVSHAVQMANAWRLETIRGADSLAAARQAFSVLFVPGAVALLTDLKTIADRDNLSKAFNERMWQLRKDHARKPSLTDRFDHADDLVTERQR